MCPAGRWPALEDRVVVDGVARGPRCWCHMQTHRRDRDRQDEAGSIESMEGHTASGTHKNVCERQQRRSAAF